MTFLRNLKSSQPRKVPTKASKYKAIVESVPEPKLNPTVAIVALTGTWYLLASFSPGMIKLAKTKKEKFTYKSK
jgi:hypothetical protein